MQKVFVGFDGFIDLMVRPVKCRYSDGRAEYFTTIEEFSHYISMAAGKSADIELEEKFRKFGGNGPIIANALADFNLDVMCMGAFDLSEASAYEGFSDRVTKINLGKPALCTAYEFQDGKLMFSDLTPMHNINWKLISKKVNMGQLKSYLSLASLVVMADWSNGLFMTEVWRETLSMLTGTHDSHKPMVFVDFADPFKRTDTDINSVLQLLREKAECLNIHVGMNLNEAIHICRILDIPFDDVLRACIEIAGKLGVTAVVHTLDQAYAADRNELQISHGAFIEVPVVSTGGGDHFNAGYCCALIEGRTLKEAIQWGNRSANYYVSTGKNISFADLIK